MDFDGECGLVSAEEVDWIQLEEFLNSLHYPYWRSLKIRWISAFNLPTYAHWKTVGLMATGVPLRSPESIGLNRD